MSAGSPKISSETATKPQFYAFVSQNDDISTLKKFASEKSLPESNILQGDITTATEFLRTNTPPEVLVVEIGSREAAADQLGNLAEVCDPDTKVVVIGTINEYSFYCWLNELGISSYLLRPLTPDSLRGAWEKAIEPPPAAGADTEEKSVICSFIGARGGVGNTSLAIMTAAALGESSGKKVALVDLDPLDGSISLLLDLEPSRGFREVLERPDRIDNLYLDKVMQNTPMGFYVLSAEESMHEQVAASPQAAATLLSELRQVYGVILLDIPRHLTPFYVHCLQHSDHVFVTTELSLQGLRDTMRLTDYMRDHLQVKDIVPVANRVGLAPKHEMVVADFNKGIGSKVFTNVAFSPETFMEMTAETKISKLKNAQVMKSIKEIADRIVPSEQEEGEKEEAGKKGFGWIKKGK